MEGDEEKTMQVNGQGFGPKTQAILDAIKAASTVKTVNIPLDELHQMIQREKAMTKEILRLTDVKEPELKVRIVVGRENYGREAEVMKLMQRFGQGYVGVKIENISENPLIANLYETLEEKDRQLREIENSIVKTVRGINAAKARIDSVVMKQPWYLRWIYRKWLDTPDPNDAKDPR
jgi:hypothetical protein